MKVTNDLLFLTDRAPLHTFSHWISGLLGY